MELKSAFCT